MAGFDENWADCIWSAVELMNKGRGASWKLCVATLAITGCRPAALERGVTFSLVHDRGKRYIEAIIKGVKLTENRGQPEHRIRWATDDDTHRPSELRALVEAMMASPKKCIVIQYDAEAISARLREVSQRLWPRRKYHITGYCYRELLSSVAKEADTDPAELAMALGHLSTESQGAYARARRRHKNGSRKPWGEVSASHKVRVDRSPMARFKAAASLKKRRAL